MNIAGKVQSMNQTKEQFQRQEITVCPNCKYHYKILLTESSPLISQKDTLLNHKEMTSSYKSIQQQTTREQIVVWKEFSMRKLQENQLIQALKIKGATAIQKLKNLNDLNQLKKSRLMDSRTLLKIQGVNSKPVQRNFQPTQKKLGDSRQLVTQQIDHSVKQDSIQHQISQEKMIQECLSKKIIEQILNYLLQWIQTFDFNDKLPGFLRQMVENYRNQYQQQRQAAVLLNIPING